MVAEYQPQTGKYYYYTTDQIGSTRIVTDDTGNIAYAAAHDPYGGVRQFWNSTCEPERKFVGAGDEFNFMVDLSEKSKNAESGLYYFGARYYDPTLYRFLSPDPVISTDRALYNPQRWNLYGYCGNNPLSNIEVYGAYYVLGIIYICRQFTVGGITYGALYFFNPESLWAKNLFVPYRETKERASVKIPAGTYVGQFRWTYAKVKDEGGHEKTIRVFALLLYDLNGKPVQVTDEGETYNVGIHSGPVDEAHGCIIVDKETMNEIMAIFNYYWAMFEKASYAAMMADQINQVLFGFAALDWLSEFYYFHFYWVYIYDPPDSSQAQAN